MQQETGQEWISLRDAVTRFGVSRQTLTRWINDGTIKVRRRDFGMVRVFVDARELAEKLQPKADEE